MSRKPIRVTSIKILDYDDGTMSVDFKYDPSLDIEAMKKDLIEGRPGQKATLGEMYAAGLVKILVSDERVTTINMPSGTEVPVLRNGDSIVCADPDVPQERIEEMRSVHLRDWVESLEMPKDKSRLN